MTAQSTAETFVLEATDLLAEIEAATRSMVHRKSSLEALDHIVTAFETIGRSGTILGFEQVATFTSYIEDLLHQVRQGQVPVNEQLLTIVLLSANQIKSLLSAIHGGATVNPDLQRLILESVMQIVAPPGEPSAGRKTLPLWQIRFEPKPDFLANGGSPLLLFRELKKLGFCSIKGHNQFIPPLEQLHPGTCYIWWTIELSSYCSEAEIRAIFSSSDDREQLQITQPYLPNGTAPSPHAADLPQLDLQHLKNHAAQLLVIQARIAQAAAPIHSPALSGAIEELARLAVSMQNDILALHS